jgi:3-oxoacyl-[acyl-carrier-protein] synthase-1/3-oxoacyl-[acyl-carrier-protein] synthase II
VSDVAILAFGAVSALGEGAAAVHAGDVGEAPRVAIVRDEELERAGLRRPFVARASIGDPEDRATELLVRALAGCCRALDASRAGWRARRVGLILGTSSGGMRAAERAFAALAAGGAAPDAEAATYFGPMARAARGLGCSLDPAMLVLGACASSTLSLGLGMRCLERDACDIVLAGGFDDVTVFVAAGFEVLRATTATPPPRPFRRGRDGMALGEGAAVLALARSRSPGSWYVTGFGAAADAVHLTAPDREGSGLARASSAALVEAGRPAVDLASVHATATPFNDAAEARALARVLEGARPGPVVHPFKAQIGHTLGAAGALELLACVDAMQRGILPAAAGEGDLDPDAPARLLERAAAGSPRVTLKLSSAFGGANASLVVADAPGTVRPVRPVFVHGVAHVDREPELHGLAAALGMHPDRLGRTDALVRLALEATRRLQEPCGPLRGAGIVAGSALATLETNAAFAAGIRTRGARAAEPRLFPYTSPNAVAGECAIAFGLTGPGFSVGGGMHAALEALVAASLLVGAGDAERMVVVAADEAGPTTRGLGAQALVTGAIALLLSASPDGARALVGTWSVRRGPGLSGPEAPGHLALLPALDLRGPRQLACASPPDALAVVRLEPV